MEREAGGIELYGESEPIEPRNNYRFGDRYCLDKVIMTPLVNYVVDMDIEGFFDSIDRG